MFYTHSHLDHIGMMNLVPKSVPQYMSKGTYDMICIKYDVLSKKYDLECKGNQVMADENNDLSGNKDMIKKLYCITWPRPKPKHRPETIEVGDIKITPFFVSHSTYDANMLLIEAGGKTILHTGDYRGHGYLSKGLFATLRNYVGQVDYLITEGTMLNRNDICETEYDVSMRMYHSMMAFRYVFVLVSSTDIERLAAIHSATIRAKRMFVSCSLMHYSILDYFRENAGHKLFDFKFDKYSPTHENQKLISKMRGDGFTMLVSPSHGDRVERIVSHFNPNQTLLIYSSWDGYYKIPEQVEVNPSYKSFRELFNNVVDIHTSGHADVATITEVIKTVNPRVGIIGIHKDVSTSLTSLDLPKDLKEKIIPERKQIDCITIK